MPSLSPFQKILLAFVIAMLTTVIVVLNRDEEDVSYSPVSVVLADGVSTKLAKAWEDGRRPEPWNERVYCIERYSVQLDREGLPLIVIDQVGEASDVEATPISVSYSCGPAPAIHTHPPFECEVDAKGGLMRCDPVAEGLENCEPSDTDVASVKEEWHRFHGVQCAPDKFLWFVPYWM
jgi:hypothetical protein